MPFLAYDADLSGHGTDALGSSANRVYYVAWDVLTLGAVAHPTNGVIADSVAGLGGVALGDHFDIVGGSDVDRWHDPIWFNILRGLWVPTPNEDPSGFTRQIATRLKWDFASGATVHVRILGDAV